MLWDLLDGSRLRTVRFEAPIFIAELHPNNQYVCPETLDPLSNSHVSSLMFVAALFDAQPVLVDVTAEIPLKTTLPSAPKRSQLENDSATEKQIAQDAKQATTALLFSLSGQFILAATNKGWLNIIDTDSCQPVFSTRLTNSIITTIRLSSSGRELVVNASDRIIRTFDLPDLKNQQLDFDNVRIENEHKFQDIVNRLSWTHVSFSATGEYVVASIYMNHHLYVWEREHGSLEKILEGPKEELSSVEVGSKSNVVALQLIVAVASLQALYRRDGNGLGPCIPLVDCHTTTLVSASS